MAYINNSGAQLRQQRTSANFSIDRLSRESGVKTETIRKIEAGKSKAQYRTLVVLAQTLQIDVKTLLATEPQQDSQIQAANGQEADFEVGCTGFPHLAKLMRERGAS